MKFVIVLIFAGITLSWADTTRFFENLLRGYDKNDFPLDGQTNVKLGIYLNTITLDKEASSMKVLMYFRQSWQDDRLIHSGSVDKRRVPSEFIEKIWRPDTFFSNARTIQLKQEMTDERLMSINSTGDVWYVQSLYVDFVCNLEQPRGATTCSMKLESYGNLQDRLNYEWLKNPLQIDSQLQMSGYSIIDNNLHDCSQNFTMGPYSCLDAVLVFQEYTLMNSIVNAAFGDSDKK